MVGEGALKLSREIEEKMFGPAKTHREFCDKINRTGDINNILKNKIKALVDSLSDEERMDLFSDYCLHCGRVLNGRLDFCHCWNDD